MAASLDNGTDGKSIGNLFPRNKYYSRKNIWESALKIAAKRTIWANISKLSHGVVILFQ